ncbi:hypothetical protein LguiA_023324 [Lonicera macranthoides]
MDPTERDNDRSSQEECDIEDGYGQESDSDDDSIGSNLYKDEEDRQKLAQMSELDREMILTERATKRMDRKLQENMRRQKEKMIQSRKDNTSPTMSSGVRSSARSADRAAAKDDALNELRAKRLRQQDPEAHWKLRDAARGGSGSRGYTPIMGRNIAEATLNSSSRNENGSCSDEEDSTGVGGMVDSNDDKTSAEVGIRKSRSGPIYRLCIVQNVNAGDPDRRYKLENKTTHKYLNVVWGHESSAARWQMAMISDSPPLKEEFDQCVREVERSGGRMPSKQYVSEKKDAIKKTNTFEVVREAQVKDEKAIKLQEMNRKNRFENFRKASEKKTVNTSLKAGDAEMDEVGNYYGSKPDGENEAAEASNCGDTTATEGNEEVGGVAATAAALKGAAEAGKLVDTSAPVDQGTELNALHNFILPISLSALKEFGGPHGVRAAFMVRKQRLEATVGLKVPENDGRRHALMLTVSYYKRRRGLL